MSKTSIEPFVKWAGGKRQLVERLAARMPSSYNRYFEPFVGGGALLFHIHPENATISDTNGELIHVYETICFQLEELMNRLTEIDDNQCEPYKDYYYSMRDKYNQKISNETFDVEMAALFIYINKHCFNGLYRVNRKGLFNVPFNNTSRPSYSRENLIAISEYLQEVTILNDDFQKACECAEAGDFVFFDSPYAPLNPTSFESYTKEGFSIEEHERLAKLFAELSKKNCYCMLTNHNTELIRDLYGAFVIEEVDVKRFINSDASNRVGKEVIIRNYK
ncbi:Dam family site-specific DNA-(adenine-N6)-methyltransferase [Ruminococcaceae bacterium OttesenSCG-928-O06]|nr:Dam family site-specific DNA-(adenine-N6)-methyltransferase [Ruminococcaceae bacterium OttesenSCG-928-O06]